MWLVPFALSCFLGFIATLAVFAPPNEEKREWTAITAMGVCAVWLALVALVLK